MTLERATTDPAALGVPAGDYVKVMRVRAAAGTVFDAVTTAHGLSAWWARAAGSGGSGGELQLWMHAPEPLTIHVDHATPPTMVEWTVLDCPFLPEWVGTRPTFTIVPLGR